MAIQVDPITGLKVFKTRAAKANEKIVGKGYSALSDEALTTLPDEPVGAVFNAAEQEKYQAFKERRRGAADYMEMKGEFSRHLEDLYSAEPVERDPLSDSCEILVVGAGFAGLLLWYKLKNAGFEDVRFCEKGGDVGGTWYWNRYPGVACDVVAYDYLPLLDELDYVPVNHYSRGPEILSHCQAIAKKYDLYDLAVFNTTVTSTVWDAEDQLWHLETDRGDRMRARFVICANGTLSKPKLSKIEGMTRFA